MMGSLDKDSLDLGNVEDTNNLLVVGIGASAGGVKALQELFSNIPAKTDIAYVVILHLSPDHESQLSTVLQRCTNMLVTKVVEKVKIEANNVYVIPPNKNLLMVDGNLELSDLEEPRGQRAPIDHFFRTLAESYGSSAACVILSGVGADGTLGLQRIKEYGGLTIAQNPDEAEHGDMPRNAIKTGMTDYVLPVSQILETLISYLDNKDKFQSITEDSSTLKTGNINQIDALVEALALLKTRTGHDFYNYKRGTLLRRIARRLQVNDVETIPEYIEILRENPTEIAKFLSDLLISVTNFFRDPDSFEVLEREIIPKLFEGKHGDDQVRVWVAGCATGEEAYSLAMLLREYNSRLTQPVNIQIFATDINEEAINIARAGLYPETIIEDVSPERLKRFFVREQDKYRVKKDIRENVLFASHNLLRDPPFSRIDLITCRNLLIYLNREVQNKVLELFHFALHKRGYLFLGVSESADAMPGLFSTYDKKHRIFIRNETHTGMPTLPIKGAAERKAFNAITPKIHKELPLGQLHQQLLEHYAPPSLLINEEYEIVHLSERVGHFLRLVGGEPSLNLMKIIHPNLRLETRSILFTAKQRGTSSEVRNVHVNIDGEIKSINITAKPIQDPEAGRTYFLIMFDEMEVPKENINTVSESKGIETEPIIKQLEEELQKTKDQLRTTIEQYETSTEELKASNEELQAMNEELRSTTEELETSKEELQAINEELTTVNQEMKSRIEEVSRVNSDLQNLMTSSDIGTIFLDRDLHIKRFTPNIQSLFNIISSDAGRPLTHLTHNLDYEALSQDAKTVLEKLNMIEREIRSKSDRWYLIRLLPYRTVEDKIDGVVLTFIDITERKRAGQALRESEENLKLLIECATDYAIFTLDLDGKINSWNAGAERTFGFTEAEIIGQPSSILFTPEDRERSEPENEMQTALLTGRAADERWHIRKDKSRFYASGVLTQLRNGYLRGYVKIARDLTERKKAEEELQRAHNELEKKVEERTHELANINKSLQEEIAERKHAEADRRDLLRQLVMAQEEERQRISRELHDEMGQHISALLLGLNSLKHLDSGALSLHKRIDSLRPIAERIDKDIERLALELRPQALDLGLNEALIQHVQLWSEYTKIPADLHSRVEDVNMPSYVETTVYRIVQEALTNIHKHAQASRVGIVLEKHEKQIVLIIENDGPGFDIEKIMQSQESNRKLGLIGMRERTALINGTFDIESSDENGTTIYVKIPIESEHGGNQ
jgi:two-component system, chemotaxis family, CheB/CheR fusion protein